MWLYYVAMPQWLKSQHGLGADFVPKGEKPFIMQQNAKICGKYA